MDKVKLYLHSFLQHNALIVTGFHELEKQGKIELQIIGCNDGKGQGKELPFPSIIEAEINNQFVVAFDMIDGYEFDFEKVERYLDTVDFYFKRSFSQKKNEAFSEKNRTKIYPISLNWNISYFTNPLEWTGETSALKTFLKKIILRNDICYYERTSVEKEGTVLFMCRLWDPDGDDIKGSSLLQMERKTINEMRISIIRKLKERYGDSFFGGVENSPIAQRLCPDLILPKSYTNRRKYMRLMKQSSVCVATTGLHGSIGWKLAEYVVAGKAIVTEPLCYNIIGDFTSGKNYLEFTDADECVASVEKLLVDRKLRNLMSQNNREYYSNFARPDRQVAYALELVGKARE